jgi:acyl-CoA thioester hydrolase
MHITPYSPEIRFSDIDAMGHVNNAIYLTYFEQSRIHFFRQLIGGQWDWKQFGVLVARNEIDYKIPVLHQDKVDIHVGIVSIGVKSFTVSYKLQRQDGVICAAGQSVMVCFNHQAGQTIAIPELWRHQMLAIQEKTTK